MSLTALPLGSGLLGLLMALAIYRFVIAPLRR